MKPKSLFICCFIFTLLVIKTEATRKWLPEVSGYSKDSGKGNVGIFGKPITGLTVSGGKEYRVHIVRGDWLPPVTGNDINDDTNGYAGTLDGKEIDAVAISGGDKYAVHIMGEGWTYSVTGYSIDEKVKEGYAGTIGKPIDAIMINGRTYATSYNFKPDQYDPPASRAQRAIEIYNFFRGKGWTKNAICGILGNIDTETYGTFDPECSPYGRHAIGILQWCPQDTLIDWAKKNGLDYKTIHTQCERLMFEFENVIRFGVTGYCRMSFRSYVYSYYSPSELAICFMYNYIDPIPRFENMGERTKKAELWCKYF